MNRSVILGAGALVLIVGGVIAVRTIGGQKAGQVLDQNLDKLMATLPAGTAVRHGATDYNPLTGTATVHDVAVRTADGTMWTATTLAVSGANADALRDVFDTKAYPDGHPAWTDRRLLLDSATLTNVHSNKAGADPGELTIGKIVLDHLRGHPFAAPPTPENRAKPEFVAEVALDIGFSLHVTGMTVQSPAPSTDRITVEKAAIEGYEGGKAETMSVHDILMNVVPKPPAKPVHASLASAELDGADATAVLAAARGGLSIDAAARFRYHSGALHGLALQVPQGPAISLNNASAEQGADGGTNGGTVQVTGLTVALAETPVPAENAPAFAAFGMNAITADIAATSRRLANNTSDLHEDVTLHDLGVLHLAGVFGNYIKPTVTVANPTAGLAALLAATLNHASVEWDDASLTERLFKVAAVRTGLTPAALRAQVALTLPALGAMLPSQPDAADQVNAFLADPHRLTVTLAPAQPVVLADVARAPVLQRAQLLGLHITGR